MDRIRRCLYRGQRHRTYPASRIGVARKNIQPNIKASPADRDYARSQSLSILSPCPELVECLWTRFMDSAILTA
jgi:hypothetical protein